MAKTITINYEGTEYTLEFTRKSIETMEKQGFRVTDIAETPMTTLPALFSGAFLAHHRFAKADVVNSIFEKLGNKQELIQKLAEMYNEPIEALLDEPGEEKNLSWGANW